MVNREITLTFDELLKRPLIEDYVTLCCVSNPVRALIGNAKWLGASLAAVLREAGIKAGADQLMCTSVDGFTSGTPVRPYGRPGRAARGGDERPATADRAWLPGPHGGARALRLRVRDQVGD